MIPNATKRKYLTNDIDYETDDFEALLINDSESFTPDVDAHEFVSDVLADGTEYGDTNYDRISIEGVTVTQNDDEDRAELSADDLLWEDLGSNVGEVIQAVVMYKADEDDESSDVIRIMDESEEDELPLATNGSNVVFEWNPDGIKHIT